MAAALCLVLAFTFIPGPHPIEARGFPTRANVSTDPPTIPFFPAEKFTVQDGVVHRTVQTPPNTTELLLRVERVQPDGCSGTVRINGTVVLDSSEFIPGQMLYERPLAVTPVMDIEVEVAGPATSPGIRVLILGSVSAITRFTVSTDSVEVGTATDLVFAVEVPISAGFLTPTATLQRVDADGNVLSVEGAMLDNGNTATGDEIEADRLFSIKKTLTPQTEGTLYFRALVTGQVTSAVSQILDVIAFVPYTDAEGDAAATLQTQAWTIYDTAVSSVGRQAALAQALAYVQQQSIVQSASITDDGHSLLINYVFNLTGSVICDTSGVTGTGIPKANIDPFTPTENLPSGSSSSPVPAPPSSNTRKVGNNKAVIYSPFSLDGQNFVNSMRATFEANCIETTTVLGAAATVDSFNDLARFGYIVIQTHGFGTGQNGECAFMTAEPFPGTRRRVPGLGAGNVHGMNYWMIFPQQVRRMPMHTNNNIVFMASCGGGFNNTLANAFFAKGAHTYLSFDNICNTDYQTLFMNDYLQRFLASGGNSDNAFTPGQRDLANAVWNTTFVKFTAAPGVPAVRYAAGLTDAGFDSGNLSAWETVGDASVRTALGDIQPRNGTHFAVVSTGLGTSQITGSVQQKFCLSPGVDYLEFWWNFNSEEFREFCGSVFDDRFQVVVIGPNFTEEIFVTSVNQLCDTSLTESPLHFDASQQPCSTTQGPLNDCKVWTTGWQWAAIDIRSIVSQAAGQPVTLKFQVTDVGDSRYDSAVCIDKIQLHEIGDGRSASKNTTAIQPRLYATHPSDHRQKVDDESRESPGSAPVLPMLTESRNPEAGEYVFGNANYISIGPSGSAQPYASTMAVSGLAGGIEEIRVTLNGFSHTYPDDVDALLVAPNGETVLLMSDTGGSFDALQVDLTFTSNPAGPVPDSSLLTSGMYSATNYAQFFPDDFPAPAPAGPYSGSLSSIVGDAANGTWRLYLVDNASGDSGAVVAGWQLYLKVSCDLDPTPPVIACPQNVDMILPPNACSAVVTYSEPQATDECSSSTVNCVPAPGSVFGLGTTTVTCSAQDQTGNTSQCGFLVTVRDVTPPVISGTANITARAAPSASSSVVTYTTPGVSDACSTSSISCSPASGSDFPLGTTQVTCTAVDGSGNSANTTFSITVLNAGDTLGGPSGLYSGAPPFTASVNASTATFSYGYGPSDLAGDWDANGTDSFGTAVLSSAGPSGVVFNVSLKNSMSVDSPPDVQFSITLPAPPNTGPYPYAYTAISGDWDGDGRSSVGFYHLQTGTFYVKNSNVTGSPDLTFVFGPSGRTSNFCEPLVGDWNGDHADTIGVFDSGSPNYFPVCLLRNSNSAGSADVTLDYSASPFSANPIVGDWDGDGIDTLGCLGTIYNVPGFYHIRNTNTVGEWENNFDFGINNRYQVVAGNWDGDPALLGVYPLAAKQGATNLTLTLSGHHLAGTTSVTFEAPPGQPSSGVTATLLTTGPWQTTVRITVSPTAATGAWKVRVNKPAPAGSSNPLTFVVRRSDGLNESDTVGLYNAATGTWYLRYANAGGPADVQFSYGPASSSMIPLKGDWNGDGVDTPGLYDPATHFFFLKNTNTYGAADLTFKFEISQFVGGEPIVGDWNNDGVDTIGLYDPAFSKFYLRNSNSAGAANVVFVFTRPETGTLIPLAGDWDNNNVDSTGLYSAATGTFYLRNANSAGGAQVVVQFGPSSSPFTPIVGDWTGTGADTIGLFDPVYSVFYLRYANTPGDADLYVWYGPQNAGWMPIVGDWDALGN